MIADDDHNALKMLEAALSMWGYTVVSACEGKEAWDILQEDDAPRIAVLDWMMVYPSPCSKQGIIKLTTSVDRFMNYEIFYSYPNQ